MENKDKEFEYLKQYILDNYDEHKIFRDKETKEVKSEIFIINETTDGNDNTFDQLNIYFTKRKLKFGDHFPYTRIGYNIEYQDLYDDTIAYGDFELKTTFKSTEKFFSDMKDQLSVALDIEVENFDLHDNHTARFLAFIQDIEKNLLKYKLEDQLKTKTTSKKSMKI